MSQLRFVTKAQVSRVVIVSVVLLVLAIVAFAQNPAITIHIDAAANRHAISPNVYGLAYPTAAQLADLNVPAQRYGGNNTSRYNWQVNGDNRGSDWYFESIGEDSPTPAGRIDSFVSMGNAAGAQSLVTIPTIGWVAKLGPSRGKLSSFSIAKYGAQTGNDWQWFPDAGNGVLTNGQNVTGNNPNEANVPADSTFQKGLVQHVVAGFGPASSRGLRYYLLDNEPSIWFATHRDVHPVGPTMDEIRSKIIDYSGMIKSVDPSALVVAPEEWGWSGYILSGYDQQYGSLHGWSTLPDRNNHGGWDYLPWLLDQLRQNDAATGKRSLDVFSVHYYPQGGEFGNDTSQQMQLLRNQSTRSLWDPAYVDQSWINTQVQLIPRIKNWVNTYYPGTLTAVTEYNWGAESSINGATTQADILGIFGREGLDLATRWTTPDTGTPTYNAIKMYRNYDGQKSGFGDTSVSDAVPNPDNLSSFAAVRSSDRALTIMLVNKGLSGTTPVTVNVANFDGVGPAQAFQLASSNAITRLSDVSYSGGSLSITLPQQSITLLVLGARVSSEPPIPPIALPSAIPSSGMAPLSVAFSGAASSDPGASITSYSWAFGDGSTGSGVSANHTYSSAGSYNATLTIRDGLGGTASSSVSISVSAPVAPPSAPSALTGAASGKVVTLNWKNNGAGQAGVYIERAPAGTTSFVRVGQVGPGVSTFSEKVPKATYLYRVQSFNSSGAVSAYSSTVKVKMI